MHHSLIQFSRYRRSGGDSVDDCCAGNRAVDIVRGAGVLRVVLGDATTITTLHAHKGHSGASAVRDAEGKMWRMKEGLPRYRLLQVIQAVKLGTSDHLSLHI